MSKFKVGDRVKACESYGAWAEFLGQNRSS